MKQICVDSRAVTWGWRETIEQIYVTIDHVCIVGRPHGGGGEHIFGGSGVVTWGCWQTIEPIYDICGDFAWVIVVDDRAADPCG